MRVIGYGAPAGIAFAILLAAGMANASDETTAEFKVPVRLKAGDHWLGEGRLYPSPAVLDIDGDGTGEVVIGDLPGRVTFARIGAEGALSAEQPLTGADGKPLKFNNW